MANGKRNITQVPTLNEAQMRIIGGKTPPDFVKKRRGRGGVFLDYVEVGYVVHQLNQAFNLMWDLEILNEQIGENQVWVKGRLRIHVTPEFSIVKTAYGGADIKRYAEGPNSGKAIDIADDLKAAAADAMKKAASLIGIASDVYYPQLDRIEQVEQPEEAPSTRSATEKQKKMIFALAGGLGKSSEDMKDLVKRTFKIESFEDLKFGQARRFIGHLTSTDQRRQTS